MESPGIGWTRKVLTVVPLIPVLAVAAIVLFALTPTAWLTVEQGEGGGTELDGLTLRAEIPIVIGSNMPYDIRDLSFHVTLVDDVRESSVTVFESDPVVIPADSEGTLTLTTDAFAPTVFLVLGDLIEREGSVLTFDVAAECSYLLGLADFRLDARLSVPLAADGRTVSYDVLENSEDAFVTAISGLSPSLVPDDTRMTVSGGGCELLLETRSSGDGLTISVTSDGDLDGSMATVRAAEDKSVSGISEDLSDGEIDTLLDVIGFARGYM